MKSELPSKICASCGRPMSWRKSWEKNWESIRYCSDSCRRQKLDKNSIQVRETLLKMAIERGPSKSLCPSEVARHLFPDDWESHMEEVRRVARQLHHKGDLEITQKGEVIKDLNVKGPIRIRIAKKSIENF
jgi:hypothetical protein